MLGASKCRCLFQFTSSFLVYLPKMGFSNLSRTILFLYWALIFEVPCLNCFQFIEVSQNPLVVVIGHNSTDVKLHWEFDLDGGDHFNSLVINRYKLDVQVDQTKVEMASYYSSGYTKTNNDTLYALNASGISPRGFATFLIKNILLQDHNKDGTKFDPLDPDVTYVYRIAVTIPNLRPTTRENRIDLQVEVPPKITALICQGCDGGSAVQNQTITLLCNATGKPMPNIRWMKNGEHYNGSSSVPSPMNKLVFQQVAIHDKGNYTCIADNGVGNPDRKSFILHVKFPSSCEIRPNSTTVNETDNVSLNVITTGNPPVYEYIWTHPNGSTLTANSRLAFTASRQDTGTYKVSVYNGVGDRGICTSNVTVQYFDEPDICKNQTSILINRTQYTLNVTGNPRPTITCRLGKNKTSQSYTSDEKGTFKVTFFSNNVELICEISGKAGKCNFTLYKEIPATPWNFTFTITNKNLRTKREAIDLNTITAILRVIYQEKPYFKDVKVLGFVQGNLIVNFQLIIVGAAADYLQPLKNAVIEKSPKLRGLIINLNSIQNGLFAPTTSPTTGIKITTLSTEPTTSPTLTDAMIIVIVVVVVVLLIFIIMVIVCYCKKKRQKDKKNCVVEEVVVVTDGARDNDGYSPSQYAHHGPSHIDPAYDSVEVRKGAKNKNDNQTKSGGEKGGPTYAAVDKTKKNKRKKPDEVTYASLADTQPPGGRGGIVLEPLRKGQHTKMPDKYEETRYAKIVGTKKPASGNQNAAGASNNIPLADMHGQGAETESKPSDQTADPAKQNDHKPATNKKEKPPDNQGQPPTKEDSADSLPDLNCRNKTTMTTVSL